ncbi:hypothetical protein D6774_01300 [Candidatus Woesearchaeota archaeon]|nr:MAG: hypothetical protein D6774_01300 [Candidatus Woesearchaeota archaeon]
MAQESQVARASWIKPYALGFASAFALSISAYFATPYVQKAATTTIHHLQETAQEVSYCVAKSVFPHLSDQHKKELIQSLAVSEDVALLAALSFDANSFYEKYTLAISEPVEPLQEACNKQYALASTDERALHIMELYETLDENTKTLVTTSFLIETTRPTTAISNALPHYPDSVLYDLDTLIEQEHLRRRFESAHHKGRETFDKIESYYHYGLEYLRKKLGGEP